MTNVSNIQGGPEIIGLGKTSVTYLVFNMHSNNKFVCWADQISDSIVSNIQTCENYNSYMRVTQF